MTNTTAPYYEYDASKRRSPALREFSQLLRYRDLVYLMVINNIKTRYKRSTLGIAWTLLNPVLNMAVLTLAFSTLFHSTIEHYPVYVLAGLIYWNFVTQTSLTAMNTLVWGGGLLKRIYVPRTIFTVSAVGGGLVNLALAHIPLVLIILFTGHPIHLSWVYVPFTILLLTMFTLGVSLFMSALAVFFVDIVDIYQVLIQIGFFLTPLVYPKSLLPVEYGWIVNLNPMYYLIEFARSVIYAGTLPGPAVVLVAIASAVIALGVGWLTFTWKADEFAYRL
jgi:ABC-type polysaccharide/polyol phosphate export permease